MSSETLKSSSRNNSTEPPSTPILATSAAVKGREVNVSSTPALAEVLLDPNIAPAGMSVTGGVTVVPAAGVIADASADHGPISVALRMAWTW